MASRFSDKAKERITALMVSALTNDNSIGSIETLAGIERDHESRLRFWLPFAGLEQPIEAGMHECRRIIRDERTAWVGL